jgi:hypothetical protein
MDMAPIHEDAPLIPNVFTDGSVLRSNDPLTALGTYGAWHVRRTAHTPITPNERYVTEHHQTTNGSCELFGCLRGEAISSGRTEVAGALLAALAPYPVNAAIDNKSAVTIANAIHDQTINLQRWPWALRKNVDIWSTYQRIVQARGHNTIRATKVKAHQDDKSQLTPAQLYLAVGNDHADTVAKDARRYHTDFLKQYLSVTEFRNQHYKRLVTAIHMLLIRTSNATIINYRTHCRIDPADKAPISAAIKQRPLKRPKSRLLTSFSG